MDKAESNGRDGGCYCNPVWYFYEALKYKNGKCFVHPLHLFFLIIHVVNIGLITTQTIYFGNDRISFLNEANRGRETLSHLLIKDWDSRWDVINGVNSEGEFAKYTVDDLVSAINFAVQRYHNVEENSIGIYMIKPEDKMEIKFTYFDYPGFSENNSSYEINIVEKMIAVDKGLMQAGDTAYTYNLSKELDHANISQPIKKMLSTSLEFQMHSVRVLANVRKARCLWIQGEVIFSDLENNGQVVVDLQTHTTRIKCVGKNNLEPVLEYSSKSICIAVIVFSSMTMAAAVYKIVLGFALACIYRSKKPQTIMDQHNTLSSSDYRYIFANFIWDILTIIGDVFNILGSVAVLTMGDNELQLATIDKNTVFLGIGCLFSWLTVLRFSKSHVKFNLLFKTMYKAFWNVLAYLACVSVLFIGFWMSGYFVIGPYHRKKQQKKGSKNKGTNESDNDALNRKETLKDFMEITLGEQLWNTVTTLESPSCHALST
ncbi:mucolipin-1-like isoform X2 [Dreissena polymorpha]|uniref:mucolipin-1-like isoform X2 n=1 Tax=Dreissena polymorpha TaxID=45954 RepID=UPI0022646BC0|nr:mucolipin-1-like isoform X2 [Dreissena polymorpha]XP_052253164.1 mucolipin-1-like isoform X2 [Dreissena polymorpha]